MYLVYTKIINSISFQVCIRGAAVSYYWMGNKDSGVPVRGSPRPARRGDRSGGAADSPPVACARENES